MRQGTTSNAGSASREARPDSPWKRVVAIMEVAAAFTCTHVAFRALKQFTPIGQWEGAARTNFTPGAVMIVFTVIVLVLCHRNFDAYGLSCRNWRSDLNWGLAVSVTLLAVGAAGLAVTRFHFDPSHPPDPHAPPQLVRMAGGACLGVAGILGLVMLWGRRRIIERIPVGASASVLLAVLAVPSLVAARFHRASVWPGTLWLFFGAGFGEEIFYRGYIQSRIDQAFGRPFRLFGTEFGPGLLVSSILFGFLHALNTVDYFHGRFDFGWWYALSNFFWGLFYGWIRATTKSVWPGAIAHGLLDALGRVPSLLRQ